MMGLSRLIVSRSRKPRCRAFGGPEVPARRPGTGAPLIRRRFWTLVCYSKTKNDTEILFLYQPRRVGPLKRGSWRLGPLRGAHQFATKRRRREPKETKEDEKGNGPYGSAPPFRSFLSLSFVSFGYVGCGCGRRSHGAQPPRPRRATSFLTKGLSRASLAVFFLILTIAYGLRRTPAQASMDPRNKRRMPWSSIESVPNWRFQSILLMSIGHREWHPQTPLLSQ